MSRRYIFLFIHCNLLYFKHVTLKNKLFIFVCCSFCYCFFHVHVVLFNILLRRRCLNLWSSFSSSVAISCVRTLVLRLFTYPLMAAAFLAPLPFLMKILSLLLAPPIPMLHKPSATAILTSLSLSRSCPSIISLHDPHTVKLSAACRWAQRFLVIIHEFVMWFLCFFLA